MISLQVHTTPSCGPNTVFVLLKVCRFTLRGFHIKRKFQPMSGNALWFSCEKFKLHQNLNNILIHEKMHKAGQFTQLILVEENFQNNLSNIRKIQIFIKNWDLHKGYFIISSVLLSMLFIVSFPVPIIVHCHDCLSNKTYQINANIFVEWHLYVRCHIMNIFYDNIPISTQIISMSISL